MAHSDRRARNATLVVCAMLLNGIAVSIACAQAPSLVYKTQVYGRGNADSLPAAGDANLGKNAMVVDPAGNIYVTGTTFNGLNTDFLTVKYNAAGAIQWRAVTNGAANGDDIAYAVAVDANGNVLVTGSSQSNGQSDYLTVKYDNNGVEQWRATMDGAARRDDEAYAIAVDAAGNAIVTGASFASSNNYDYLTVKYSPAGVEQWRMSMNGVGNSTDRAVALCVDAGGNAVVTGFSFNNTNFNFDYVTVKYLNLPNGPVSWTRSMNGSTNSNDVAFAMACDASGNVHVTGKSFNVANNNFDYLTVKYAAANGFEQWRAITDGAGSANDASFAIAVDSAGDVIVTGQGDQNNSAAPSVTNPVHLTVKYAAANGFEQWRASLNGSGTGVDIYSALTTDSAGNIYTTGFAGNGGNNELVVVKYAPGGAPQWQAFVTGVGSASSAALMAIAVDTGGNVIVTGYRSNGVENDFLVVKFDSTGNELWRATEGENTGLTTTLASGAVGRNALAIDSAGGVYVTGQSGLATNGDFVTAKVNSSGTVQWQALLNGPSGGVDRAYALAVDGSGNVYVTGDSFAAGHSDYMTVKYDTAGVEQWRAQPGHAANASNSARALAVDAAGNVMVAGYASTGTGFLTIKYSANGVEQWKVPANSATGSSDTPVAMAVDTAGNIVVTGHRFDGVQEGYLTVMYNPSGVEQWRAVLTGNGTEPRQVSAVAIDSAGNVVVAGDSTVKYSASGIQQWYTADSFRAYALALGTDASIVVAGTGGLIVKYAGNGVEQWRRAINGAVDGNDLVYALAVDVDGSVYVTGRNAADTSGNYLTVKYGADGTERWRFTTSTAGGGANGSPVLALDANRNIILAGNAVTGGLPSAIMIAKFTQAPQAPAGVTAVAGNGMASIRFTAPPATESPVSSYAVTCQPGSIITTGPASPILVAGLANNATYLCSVTATNAFGAGAASAVASVTPSASAPLALFAVTSRKTHGPAGDFALNIDFAQALGGAVTVEPRAIGAGHKVVFKFNNTVTAVGAVSSVDINSMQIGSASANYSGNEAVVTLTGVPDNQRVLVTIAAGSANGSVNASSALGFLVGDVSNTRTVNATDISAVKAHVGQTSSMANFKFDLDVSGNIGTPDLSAVKARSGLVLP